MSSLTTVLPLRTIPGGYGLPLLGPLKDRLDYSWFQGAEKFFRSRIEKNNSTVFRTNVPPCFLFSSTVNPNVIALTDSKSFSNLFDMSIVEKKDVLVGDFMPSVDYTGKIRVLAYLDPSEPKHSQVKNFAIDVLKSSSYVWVESLLSNLDTMWATIEAEITKSGSASFLVPLQKCLFSFLTKSLIGADPAANSSVGENGYVMLDKWVALQILPTVSINVLQPLTEIFAHSFTYPFFLVRGDYQKLYDFIKTDGKEVLQKAEREYNLTADETIHHLLFILGFNAFGGFSIFIPKLLSTIGQDKTGLQAKLREEVRKHKEELGFKAIQSMDLVRSTVCEVLRLNPPVPLQYARARKDFVLSSHESSYQIRKGELLCGYQTLAMRDGKVFERAEEFVADRFTGKKGQELLNYLFWSNGPQTGTPSASNKQCAAKDYVVDTACIIVAWIFTRYDEFRVDDSGLKVSSVVKAGQSTGA